MNNIVILLLGMVVVKIMIICLFPPKLICEVKSYFENTIKSDIIMTVVVRIVPNSWGEIITVAYTLYGLKAVLKFHH